MTVSDIQPFLMPAGAIAAAIITATVTWKVFRKPQVGLSTHSQFQKRFDGTVMYGVHFTMMDGRPIISHHRYNFDKLDADTISGTRDEFGEDHTYRKKVSSRYSIKGAVYDGVATLQEYNGRKTEVAVTLIAVPHEHHMQGIYASTANLDGTGRFVAPIILFDEIPTTEQSLRIERELMWQFYDPNHRGLT